MALIIGRWVTFIAYLYWRALRGWWRLLKRNPLAGILVAVVFVGVAALWSTLTK